MIYLHFLDRELRESVGSDLDYKSMVHIIKISILMSEKLYMAYSHFFETCKFDKDLEDLVIKLNKLDLLDCVTSHTSYEDFINTHRKLYAHDKERYPFYFDKESPAPNLTQRSKGVSTTKTLWSQMLIDEVFCDVIEDEQIRELKEFIFRLGDKAVTKAAFVGFLEKLPAHQRKVLSKKINLFISEAYTKKYLGTANHLITGIKDINYYDYLQTNTLLYNINLYEQLLNILDIVVDDELIDFLIRTNKLNSIKLRLKDILLESIKIIYNKNGECNESSLIDFFMSLNLGYIKLLKDPYEKLFALSELISREKQTSFNVCDYLIVCATDAELNSITSTFTNCKLIDSVYFLREGDNDIILLRVGMGMVNSAVATSMAIARYNPKVVIMVGYCAEDKDEVKLGDIIIANKLFNYSTGKQISESEIQNEQEVLFIKDSINHKIVAYKSRLHFSDKVDLPKDFDFQVWEFLLLLNDYGCVKIDKIDCKIFPDLEQVIDFCKSRNIINFEKDNIKINENGKEFYYELQRKNPQGLKQYEPKIRFAVMACGSYVQQQENIFNILKVHDRKTIALDMESYAVANSAEKAGIPFLIIKGVGDFANDHKKFANRFIHFSTYNSFDIALQIIANCNL